MLNSTLRIVLAQAAQNLYYSKKTLKNDNRLVAKTINNDAAK
jgi:hypothetical protein